MCKSKGLTKPEGVVKARLWRESYGDPVWLWYLFTRLRTELKLLLVNSLDADASSGLTSITLVTCGCVVSTEEHACYDPKDSELCLARAKPQETGVEARSRCDVQIHGISWA